MEVKFAFLCDYADQSSGKISAIGVGFDTIYAGNVPARHPLFFSVISIKFSTTEAGPKRVGMHLTDADCYNIGPACETTSEVGSTTPGFLYRNQQIALAMHGVTFPSYGDYTVSWLVCGQEIKVVSLKVAQPPAPPTTV